MKNLVMITLISSLLFFNSCKREDDFIASDPDNTTENNKPFYEISDETLGEAVVEGIVTDASGTPLEGAIVQFGQLKTKTNANGYYFLNAVEEGDNKSIHFSKDNYFMTQKLLSVSAERHSRLDATLYDVEVETVINSEATTIEHDDFEIIIPANAFSEEVTLKATAHRVTDPNFTGSFPGNFEGVRTDGSESAIESHGFLNVEISNSDGLVDPALPVTLKLKAPEYAESEVPTWYYDFSKKQWIEEGSAILVGENYEFNVTHFTPWNIDKPVPRCTLRGRVVDQFGTPLAGALVENFADRRGFVVYNYTDEEGRFSFSTLANREFVLQATWEFYEPSELKTVTTPAEGGDFDSGDLVIVVGSQYSYKPEINSNLDFVSSSNAIIYGQYFGNEYKNNYHILIDGRSITSIKTEDNLQSETETGRILNWSMNQIQFTLPSWVNDEGTIQVVRGSEKSNVVEYVKTNLTIKSWDGIGQIVTSIKENSAGELFISTEGGNGLYKLLNDNLLPFGSNIGDAYEIAISSNDEVILGTENGIFRLDGTTLVQIGNPDPGIDYEVNSIAISSNDELIFSTKDKKIYKLENDQIIDVTDFYLGGVTQRETFINELYFDSKDNLWISTNDNGLIKHSSGTSVRLNTGSEYIYTVTEDLEGNVIVSTKDDGLLVFNDNNQVIRTYNSSNTNIHNNIILSLAVGNNGDIWCGTFGSGVVRISGNEVRIFEDGNSSLTTNFIDVVYADRNGYIWVGSLDASVHRIISE